MTKPQDDNVAMSELIQRDEGLAEDENAKRMAKMKHAGRRQAVAAESTSAAEVKDYVKPVYSKDATTKERIKGVIKGNDKMQVLFGHLSDVQIEDVVNAFQEISASQGDFIIRQGDEGDCLYIINSGTVDVHVSRPGANGQSPHRDIGAKVASLGSGALFGELALMYSAPRAATVKIASASCKLWKLDREPFKMLLAQQANSTYEMYEGWLSEVDILKSLNHFELSQLSEMLQSDLYDAGEDIIKQGDPGECFYILEDGTCAAFIGGPGGEKKVKDYTRKGDYFGEIALMQDVPRKATIRATGEGASVLWMSKDDFTAVMGPIKDILAKDIGKYPQYAEFLR